MPKRKLEKKEIELLEQNSRLRKRHRQLKMLKELLKRRLIGKQKKKLK